MDAVHVIRRMPWIVCLTVLVAAMLPLMALFGLTLQLAFAVVIWVAAFMLFVCPPLRRWVQRTAARRESSAEGRG